MIYLEGFLLTLMLFIGGLCIYHDTKLGKIPNRIVGPGILTAVCIQIIYNLVFAQEFALHWLLILSISCIISIAMYFADLWGAGDAKLFIFSYLCTPSRLLDGGSLSFVVTPYIFIFLPAMVWIILDSLFQAIHKEKKFSTKMDYKFFFINWAMVLLNSFAFHGLLSILMPSLLEENALFCSTLVIVYAYITNSIKSLRSLVSIIIHMSIIIICIVLGKIAISFENWQDYLIVLVVLFIQRWAARYNYREIHTASVTAGMVLDTNTVLRFQKSRVKGLPHDCSERMRARITDDEAEAVRRWETSAQGKPTVTIVRRIPFAFFISLGFMLWMIHMITRWP